MSIENGFDPKDLEDICSRKRIKFKMKKADYKELGRNLLLGSVDVSIGCLGAAAIVAGTVADLKNSSKHANQNHELKDGFRDGHSGYGYYFGDIKNDG
ncbi:hypothetical protein [Yersinia hibernica]|uniref:Uncharacterized protein n=1 Tax=Yersinia enterocolitica LC20 TaxID=1443113 RepID=A0A7U4GD22_YEREN|nr:hypothetical protein [Yersinia hibernica]AHM72155.1 hypothetical protein LC20_00899 [Yersinia hibernica]HEN3613523.1 hypothetical protein [Yersinia enterocolitica]